MNEVILIVPRQADRSTFLAVEDGASRSRMRLVEIRTAEQRRVLDEAKRLAKQKFGNRRLTKLAATPEQARNRLYYILRAKLGITKERAGVTLEGLRMDYEKQLSNAS